MRTNSRLAGMDATRPTRWGLSGSFFLGFCSTGGSSAQFPRKRQARKIKGSFFTARGGRWSRSLRRHGCKENGRECGRLHLARTRWFAERCGSHPNYRVEGFLRRRSGLRVLLVFLRGLRGRQSLVTGPKPMRRAGIRGGGCENTLRSL